MPTLDQLAPAIAVSDTDEMLISQNGICVKATRAQVIAGLQTELSVPSGSLTGRSSAGTGGPESITVGANLTLAGGILSASAAPYVVAALPQGMVPAINDMVPLGQSGANTAVSYSQFMSGMSNIPSINASNMLVTPSGSATSTTVASLAANTLPLSGGKMNGPLLLAGDHVQPLHASTKEYVDAQTASYLPKAGGALLGPLSLAGDPTQPSHAATKRYADKVLAFEAVYSDEGYVGMCSYDFTQLPAGVQVIAHCHGIHTPNDGGGGEFFWVATSTDNHDGFTTYNPSSNTNYASPGRWKRRIDPNHVCPEMAGAYGDGVHDDWVPLQVALDVGCQLFGQVCIRLTQGKSYFVNYGSGRQVGGVKLQYANAGALLVPNHCVIEGFGGALGLTGRAGFENAPQLLLHPQMTIVLAWFAEIRDCQVLRANMNGPVDHFAPTGPSNLADEQAQVALWLSEDGTNPNINAGVRSIGITNYGHDTKISRVLVMGFHTAYYSNGYGRGTVDELYFDTAGKGIEITESADDALVHRCYSNGFWSNSIAGQSNVAGMAGVRPGIAFDFHDKCDGLRCVDCSAVTWATQFHLKNVWSVTLVNPNGEPGRQAIGTVTRGIWTEQCVSHTVIINPLIDGNTYKCDFQHVPFSQATPTGANGTAGPGQYGTASVAVIGGSIQGNPGGDSANMVGIRLGPGSSGSITNVNFAGFPAGNSAISVQPGVGIWKINGCIPSFGVAWPFVSFQAVGNQLALDQGNIQQFGNDPIDGTQSSQITVSAPIIANGGMVVTSTGGTAPRNVRDRFAETFSVKDFGAVLDGNTDDTAAFLAAYQSVPAGSVIRVPAGIANIKDWSQWGIAATNSVQWEVDGSTTPDGNSLASSIPGGAPVFKSNLPGNVAGSSAGSNEFSRASSQTTDQAVLHTAYRSTHVGGSGNVNPNVRSDTYIFGAPDDNVWGSLASLHYVGTGGTGQHVAVYGQAIRQQAQSFPTSVTIALVNSSPTIAVTDVTDFLRRAAGPVSSANPMICQVGPNGTQYELIGANAVGSASNGLQPGTLTFSTNVSTWDAPAGAVVYAQDNPPIWAACLESRDSSLLPADLTGAPQLVVEMDLFADGPDTHGRRQVQSIVLGRQNPANGPAEFGGVIDVYFANGSGSQGDCVHTVLNPFVPVKYAAIDLRNISGVNGATPAAISLQSGHPITLDQDQARWLYWNPTSSSLQYQVAGAVRWSVDDVGNLSTGSSGTVGLGQLTVATLPTGTPGSLAYVKDGRKPSEAPGSGTGVLVFHDGAHWVSTCSGTPVQS